MPPLVGISCYTPAGSDSQSYSLPAEYLRALWRAGVEAVVLPGGCAGAVLDRLDGVVLAGGGDLDPASYRRPAHELNYFVDPERDRFEMELLTEALGRALPVLAICRGMQVLNVVFGGNLVAHVPDSYGESVPHRKPPRDPVPHSVEVAGGSLLESIVGEGPLDVVSWHHQAIDRLGSKLLPVAWAADSLIEAVEVDQAKGWVLGLQWHPELNAAKNPRQQAIFAAFAAAAGQFAERAQGERERGGLYGETRR